MAERKADAARAFLKESQGIALSPERAAQIAANAERLNRIALEMAMRRERLEDPARFFAVLAGALPAKGGGR